MTVDRLRVILLRFMKCLAVWCGCVSLHVVHCCWHSGKRVLLCSFSRHVCVCVLSRGVWCDQWHAANHGHMSFGNCIRLTVKAVAGNNMCASACAPLLVCLTPWCTRRFHSVRAMAKAWGPLLQLVRGHNVCGCCLCLRLRFVGHAVFVVSTYACEHVALPDWF